MCCMCNAYALTTVSYFLLGLGNRRLSAHCSRMCKPSFGAGPLLAATMAADNIAMAAYLTIIMIIPAKNVMEAKHAKQEQAVTPQQALTIDRQLASDNIRVPDNVASALTGTAEFQSQQHCVAMLGGTDRPWKLYDTR